MIQKLSAEFAIADLCRVLEVSRSGYYQWSERVPGPRQQANERLLGQIQDAFKQSRQTYGSPRITHALRRQQIGCSENRVARLMKAHGIKP